MTNTHLLISICVIVRNEVRRIEPFIEVLTLAMANHYAYYEVFLIDNASNDGTDRVIAVRLGDIPNLRLCHLSRIYNFDTVTAAALDNAIGDYVILFELDGDLALIPAIIEKAQEGDDIVTVRRNLALLYTPGDGLLGRAIYLVASRILGFQIVLDDSNIRLYSRRVVNSLTQIRRRRRHTRYYGAVVGYRQSHIVWDGGKRVEQVKRLEKFSYIVNLIVNNSTMPLRFAALLGLLASFLNLLYLAYVMVETIIREGQLAEGWLTTSVTTTTMFFLTFIILTILTEYIGRLLEETKDEPLYFVEYEDRSTISSYTRAIEQENLNIVYA